MEGSLYTKIGADKLREVIDDFYERVFNDVMIGFLFIGKPRQRLIEKECEFIARSLGADIAYTGRSMRRAHARSLIMGGHFDRRLTIFSETMADHQVDPEVIEWLLAHQQRLRPQVTTDAVSQCNDTRLFREA